MAELYTFITAKYLPTRYPNLFTASCAQVHNLALGTKFPTTANPCPVSTLRILGEIVDEDFMFLIPDVRGALTLQAYLACFASGFAMTGLFGKNLDGLHSSVPGYQEKIAPSMQKWFAKLGSGQFWMRANVSHEFPDQQSLNVQLFKVCQMLRVFLVDYHAARSITE